ncbi:hypothetical protein PRZ48_013518 [Zasmidium cellare]|uniref:asparaginase n=1 Tax=Zasmidium cellare TaxID=395010 RepID=A0ABR0E1W2_ZASCE|nr:hypothetical protein PRZ48_013518 [Zasmidium cellare]
MNILSTILLLGTAVQAVPNSPLPRRSLNTTASDRLGLQWMGNDTSLPKVLVLFTGGTISSGSTYSALDTTEYGQISITGEEIIARDPLLQTVAQLAVSNWTLDDGNSTGTSDALVMNMTRFAHDALCSPDSDITGAIFTHGTNSLEETAFLMDLLVNCGKPIVGVGAMRPYTALSFDGDANFFESVALAASPEARDRGVLVAFSDRILSGFWVTKLDSTHPDAFHQTTNGGDLGAFLNMRPYFFNSPSRPTPKHDLNISLVSSHPSYPALPQVDILYAARQFDARLAFNSLANGASGIVIAGTGNGGIPNGSDMIAEAVEKGLQVVVGTRSPYGTASPQPDQTWAKSGYVHVIQSRIMLQLAIASGYNQNQTIELFEGTIRKAIHPFGL